MAGAKQCIANLKVTQRKMKKLGEAALIKWCYEVLRVSQMDYCPYKTGKLRNSGEVHLLTSTDTETVIIIAYTAGYSLVVHEIPMMHDIGSMKFLSTPFNLMSYGLPELLNTEMSI